MQVMLHTEQIRIGNTVNHMLKREKKRISNGHYKKSTAEELLILAVIITLAGFAGAVIWGSNGLKYYIDNWRQLTLVTFLFPLSIYIFLKISLVLRWCLYWIVLTTVVLFFLDTTEKLSNNRESLGMWVFITFVVIECTTLLVYAWTRLLYPTVVFKLSQKDPLLFWNIKPHPTKRGIFFRRFWFKKKKVSYFGSVNEKGEPHGFGKWASDWKTGEVLSGLWKDGYPIGPFRSREYRTGYAFANQRIAFVSTDTASFKKTTTGHRDHLWYGVVGVECSASGKFFSDLPQVKHIITPFDELDAKNSGVDAIQTILDNLIHYDELEDKFGWTNEITVRSSGCGLEIPGYRPADDNVSHEVHIRHRSPHAPTENLSLVRAKSMEPSFDIVGWKRDRPAREALVFITGFNCSLEIAAKLFGQMITLGGLGPSIKPFIYKWPGGTLVSYHKAKAISKSDETKSDLIDFLKRLGHAGFHKIHLLSHSMGARVVVNAASLFDDVFEPLTTNLSSSTLLSRLKLASVTFLNPETPLQQFKEVQFPQLKKFTDLITIYGSTNDIALLAAEYIFSGRKMLGSRVHDLVYHTHSTIEDPYDDQDVLDLDVIDTSELDINIHAVRHVYFSVNKFVIDDIIDVVTGCRRAHERVHRLLNLGQNVYGFLAAPSYVVK